jgi:hypothetical protein
VTDGIFLKWHQPNIDLFATKLNFVLPIYISPVGDPQAFAVDALSVDWKGMSAYAFPPTTLLLKVIQKITETPCPVLLVTPYWPRMPWFALLLQLADRPPD